jgi:very-short-patch-repair endonuclease
MPPDPRLLEYARSMRREPTPAERVMWQLLRNRQLAGFKFRRQHPLGLYIADFYSRDAALVVELDGDSHFTPEGIEHDRIRHADLQSMNLFVLRFLNPDVFDNPDGVVELIAKTCTERSGLRRSRTPSQDRTPRCRRSHLHPVPPPTMGERQTEKVVEGETP